MKVFAIILVLLAMASSVTSSNSEILNHVRIIGILAQDFVKTFEDMRDYWHAYLSNPYYFNPADFHEMKKRRDASEKRELKQLFGSDYEQFQQFSDDEYNEDPIFSNYRHRNTDPHNPEINFDILSNGQFYSHKIQSQKNRQLSDEDTDPTIDDDAAEESFGTFMESIKTEKLRLEENGQLTKAQIRRDYTKISGVKKCDNGGVLDTIKIKVYICDDQIVSKKYFEKMNQKTAGMCFEKEVSIDACNCPYDWYGLKCKIFVEFHCLNFEWTQEDQECLKNDPNVRPGRIYVPNCRNFSEDNTYNFKQNFDCKLGQVETKLNEEKERNIANYRREGIKQVTLEDHSDDIEILSSSRQEEPPNFDYIYKFDYGKMTYPMSLQFGIEFIDFDDLLHRKVISKEITKEDFHNRGHLKNITLEETIKYDNVKEFGAYGRIPFAVYQKYNDTKLIYFKEAPRLFYLKDHEYVQPMSDSLFYINVSFYLVCGLGLIMFIYCFVKYYIDFKNGKYKKEYKKSKVKTF